MQKAILGIGLKDYLRLKMWKNIVSRTYVIKDLNDEEILRMFYQKELQKTSQHKFRIEKIIEGKGDRLYMAKMLKLN